MDLINSVDDFCGPANDVLAEGIVGAVVVAFVGGGTGGGGVVGGGVGASVRVGSPVDDEFSAGVIVGVTDLNGGDGMEDEATCARVDVGSVVDVASCVEREVWLVSCARVDVSTVVDVAMRVEREVLLVSSDDVDTRTDTIDELLRGLVVKLWRDSKCCTVVNVVVAMSVGVCCSVGCAVPRRSFVDVRLCVVLGAEDSTCINISSTRSKCCRITWSGVTLRDTCELGADVVVVGRPATNSTRD